MTFWRTVFSRLFGRLRSPAVSDHAPPPLLEIPTELFDEILAYLDGSDLASLSLCNQALGSKLVEARTSPCTRDRHDSQREAFLSRIARDTPALFFCHCCRALHSRAKVPPPGSRGLEHFKDPLRCVTIPDYSEQLYKPYQVHGCASPYQFTFQHLQLAMARHQYGSKYGMELDAFSTVEVLVHFRHANTRWTTTLLSVDAKIVRNELLLRVQTWTVFDGLDISAAVDKSSTEICAHIDRGGWTTDLMSDLIRRKLHHADLRQDCCPTCHPLLRCSACDLEIHIAVRTIEQDRRKALVITKWLSLGPGKSPQDLSWRRHLWNTTGRNSSLISTFPVSAKSGAQHDFELEHANSYSKLTDDLAAILDRDAFLRKLKRMKGVDTQGIPVFDNFWTGLPGWTGLGS